MLKASQILNEKRTTNFAKKGLTPYVSKVFRHSDIDKKQLKSAELKRSIEKCRERRRNSMLAAAKYKSEQKEFKVKIQDGVASYVGRGLGGKFEKKIIPISIIS